MNVPDIAGKLEGALFGVAIGDAMGAPVEGLSCEAALERYAGHDFLTFVPPRYGNDPNLGKSLEVTGDVGRPSRAASIEELPVALAALRYGEWAYRGDEKR